MDDTDSAERWDALASKDANSRELAMETIRQEVMRCVENIGPIQGVSSSPPAKATVSQIELNAVLARLLMLSKRCPYADVREKCVWVLQSVQFTSCRHDGAGMGFLAYGSVARSVFEAYFGCWEKGENNPPHLPTVAQVEKHWNPSTGASPLI
ncbi:hypothetical protein SKAU_G00184670 [Synaphobranchus kaupii]|uniref:Uncharacterized protein n=1 Tax=Synaphobranchus kaupii TaxID=118154 RepID=A0A9Q1IWM4_SYNKA|nr:hypothetical protein SKAU_G00184670 [Synaphobranchus kaupii]